MRQILALALGAILLSAVSCGKRTETLYVDIPRYTAFRDVREAAPALRAAGRAVVKLTTAEGTFGTASFVSRDGLLLTNNHVLGIEESACAREGCWVSLALDFQLGVAPKDPTFRFLVPVAVSPELDAALYQVYTDETRTAKYEAPHALEIDALSAEELVRRADVHIIGHPHGSIKKWVRGRFYRRHGAFVYSNLYTLPGHSGSPYLNDEGKLVGIHHHASNGIGLIGRRDMHTFAYGSSARELAELVHTPSTTSGRFFSVGARHTDEDVVRHHVAYLGRRTNQVQLVGGAIERIDRVLGRQCDLALGRTYTSPEDLDRQLAPCDAMWEWLNCRFPDDGRGYKFCPGESDRDEWRRRFREVAERLGRFNSHRYLRWLVSPWRLELTRDAAVATERTILEAYLARVSPPLTFDLAFWLLDAYGVGAEHRGTRVADFVRNYSRVPGYEHDFATIFDMHDTLLDENAMTREELTRAVNAMFADERLNVKDKLSLEASAYRLGILK